MQHTARPTVELASANAATPPASDRAVHRRRVASDADCMGGKLGPTVRANLLKSNGGTAADGADANQPAQFAPEKNRMEGRGTVAMLQYDRNPL